MTLTFIRIILNVCVLWINLAKPKPIPDFESYPEGRVHSEEKSDLMRARRSIPDVDAANPAFLDTEPESGQSQELSDPNKNNDISEYTLTDTVNGLFHSHKGQEKQKLLTNQDPVNSVENWGKDEDLVRREAMPADEQEECYNQQNIDPPGSSGEAPKPVLNDYSASTDVNISEQKISSRPVKPLIFTEKGTRRLKGKGGYVDEITSLYSAPERRTKIRKEKIMRGQPKHYNSLEQISDQSVYKPVGVKAEFPVYDEDINFNPDPLQGILEDKYWLDPQEQEAVIKKYIDLANNIHPQRVDSMKRHVYRQDHHIPKSIDSKEAFRDAESVDRDCPCKEIASCDDCSRGNWKKKSNYSDRGILSINGNYGNRKLLSIKYDSTMIEESDDESAVHEDSKLDFDSSKHVSDCKNNKAEDYPFEYWDSLADLSKKTEKETQVEGEVPSFTSNYFGRKLLSFEDNDNIKEEYNGDDESLEFDVAGYDTPDDVRVQKESLLQLGSESTEDHGNCMKKSDNRRSIIFDGDLDDISITTNAKQHKSPIVSKSSTSGVYEYKLETEKITDLNKHLKPNNVEDFIRMQKPFLDKPQIARYYVPNRFGNLFQKAMKQKKPKEITTTIDPDLEFEIERNETFLNVSMEMKDINISVTTEMANLVEYHKKRRDMPVFLRTKGRRSYNLPLIKHPQVKKIEDDPGNVKAQDSNSTVNGSPSLNATFSSTIFLNSTANSTANITDTTSNTTDTTTDTIPTSNTTEHSTTQKKKKKIEEYDEDTFDAEVANDIVETVIAESQSGSVVGHNLGLCRRNSTVSKYAKVAPESEKLLKKVTECILEHIRDRLEGQSCTLLDNDLLQFLKWMVLSGESYKDYLARIKPQFREFKVDANVEAHAPSVDGRKSTITPK